LWHYFKPFPCHCRKHPRQAHKDTVVYVGALVSLSEFNTLLIKPWAQKIQVSLCRSLIKKKSVQVLEELIKIHRQTTINQSSPPFFFHLTRAHERLWFSNPTFSRDIYFYILKIFIFLIQVKFFMFYIILTD
jgi:hypothetical protein